MCDASFLMSSLKSGRSWMVELREKVKTRLKQKKRNWKPKVIQKAVVR